METVEQTYARALEILSEFSIPEELLHVLGPDERPCKRIGEHSCSDGHYFGNNESFYRATYCVHFTRAFAEVTRIEVRQEFNADELRGRLKPHISLQKWSKTKVADDPIPFGYIKMVFTRTSHICSFESCKKEISEKSNALVHYADGVTTWQGYMGHYHPKCYEKACLVDGSLPSTTEETE